MEIRHLRLIKFIVEEGSLTKAMDKLHLTQSALSHQLKEAEYQLGTKIFMRVNKKMILTKAGEKLYALANDVIDKMDDTRNEIKKMIYGESGEIKISTECYTSYHWLPSLMRQFHLLYPNVELKIVIEATHYPLQGLLNGKLDVAITSDPIKDDHIIYTELFQDEMLAVVSSNHMWAKRKFITAEDFTDENLIIHSLPLETVTIHTAVLEPAGITPKKITVVPLTEASIEMVKAEMGVFVMAQWALKPYLNNGTLKTIKIGKNGLKRKHYVATLREKPHAGYFDQFIEFLQREITL
ncbi:LysR family transcriptional regulator [bacterium]|nr:LysR family transcriptional regulator [bacterium]